MQALPESGRVKVSNAVSQSGQQLGGMQRGYQVLALLEWNHHADPWTLPMFDLGWGSVGLMDNPKLQLITHNGQLLTLHCSSSQ